ncbi:MAG: glycosyltransferase family 4 protein [Cyclobacteriaceae bacterium]
MKKLIYIAPSRASFVMQDIRWLSRDYEVRSFFFEVPTKVFLIYYLARLFLKLLLAPKAPILVSFGGYHSFVGTVIAKMKGQRSYIILNGTDSVGLSEWGYGFLRGGVIKMACYKSYDWCTGLLPVSASLMSTTNTYAFDTPKQLGVLHHYPHLSDHYQVIHNGFDVDFWTPAESRKESKSFITVVGSEKRVAHKGLDLIIEVASHYPDCTFYVAGLSHIDEAPPNIVFLGFLRAAELKKQYQRCEYYFQLSIWEGFGCALCEAMLCGCVPIVSEVNMLPDIVGNSGLVLTHRSSEDLKKLIDLAIESDLTEQKQPRENILKQYSMEKRIGELIKVIENG